MAIDFQTITGGGGGDGGGGGTRRGGFDRKKLLIGGVFVILLILVFKRQGVGTPAAEPDMELVPNTMDMPTYPNIDQQTLDNQFSNYMAIQDQQTTSKFMQVTDSLNQITQHMDVNNKGLLDAINAGLTKQITQPAPAKPVTIAPPPPHKTAAPNPLHPVSAGIHYATPRGGWNPNSIVDYLKSKGYKNSYNDRATLAKQAGISGYKGTATQNKTLLGKLKAL